MLGQVDFVHSAEGAHLSPLMLYFFTISKCFIAYGRGGSSGTLTAHNTLSLTVASQVAVPAMLLEPTFRLMLWW